MPTRVRLAAILASEISGCSMSGCAKHETYGTAMFSSCAIRSGVGKDDSSISFAPCEEKGVNRD